MSEKRLSIDILLLITSFFQAVLSFFPYGKKTFYQGGFYDNPTEIVTNYRFLFPLAVAVFILISIFMFMKAKLLWISALVVQIIFVIGNYIMEYINKGPWLYSFGYEFQLPAKESVDIIVPEEFELIILADITVWLIILVLLSIRLKKSIKGE